MPMVKSQKYADLFRLFKPWNRFWVRMNPFEESQYAHESVMPTWLLA